MACGPQEETGEQAVAPKAILQAMQTAIAQELRARCEAPQELPPDLVALLLMSIARWMMLQRSSTLILAAFSVCLNARLITGVT